MVTAPRTLPVLDDEVPLAGADPRGAWTRAGQNYVWSRFVAAGGPAIELFERIDGAVVRVPVVDRAVHVIPAGRPYRLAHVDAFWRETEADTVYLRTPAPGGDAYMLITGTSYGTYTRDRIFWICTSCGGELHALTIPKRMGLDGYLRQTADAVRAFHVDEAARTCPACAAIHPQANAVSGEVPAEELSGDWDLLSEGMIKKFSRFKRVGDNIVGIRRRMCEGDVILDPVKGPLEPSLEIGPDGIVTMENTVLSLRMTCGGTPHRVAHNFGFWHINDMDELYLTLPGPAPGEPAYCLIFMQHPDPTGHAGESVAEYCEVCLTMLFERHYRTAELGFEGVFKFFDDSMREYNGDERNRVCPECGHLNPYGYTWNPDRDTPEMAAARKAW